MSEKRAETEREKGKDFTRKLKKKKRSTVWERGRLNLAKKYFQ